MFVALRKVDFFYKGKNTFFQKFSKIGLVAEKLMITFRGGGVQTQK